MAAKTLIWLFIMSIGACSGQRIIPKTYEHHGICRGMFCNSMEALSRLENCTVVLGNLHVLLLEKTRRESFMNVSFPKLREGNHKIYLVNFSLMVSLGHQITGFLVVYRVRGLQSLAQLFPNLTRIRGAQLLYNYALIVYDMPNLREIGLYNLLKIDRGGVIIWGASQACFIDTVDWHAIAPGSRHVISADRHAYCSSHCTCSSNPSMNYCWNNRKCQRFLEGAESERCDAECLGCRKTNSSDCSLCKRSTLRGQCVPSCPSGTVVLPVNLYCLTIEECKKLGGWAWDNTCVFECPVNYVREDTSDSYTCKWCQNCVETCSSQFLRSLETIQAAERCVYINGSLTIHISSIPETVKELRTYLSNLREVSDYVVIYGSVTITSLDFLSSLRRIGGRKLDRGKYSFVVYDMRNLQSLLSANVTRNLRVDRGTVNLYGNPMLCPNHIEKLQVAFPTRPDQVDVPQGMNGYSGGCEEVSLGLQVRALNETSALVMFSPVAEDDVHYTVLYVRLPHVVDATFVPETCCESEWYAVDVPTVFSQVGMVQLNSLRPASYYAICVETYDPVHRNLARSSILSFQTLVGTPEPPFIKELVASSSESVVIRWVDHKNYRSHIVRYELDVKLIEIRSKDIALRDHCKNTDDDYDEMDFSRHAVVSRPPSNYDKGCGSTCGVLSSVTEGALVEEHFEVCSRDDFECVYESNPRINSTYGSYVKSLALNIKGPRKDFQVGGLAPFQDYKFQLRACTKSNCSRSARGVVRTLRKDGADVPVITFADTSSTGLVKVQWAPPSESNGPILSYHVEVLPRIILNDINNILPQSWCVPNNESSINVKSELAVKYLIRVCTYTMGSRKTCSDWSKIYVSSGTYPTWWWSGIMFGVLLYAASSMVGWINNRWLRNGERHLLIHVGQNYRSESEPPSFMMTDFAPMYSIPLRDTQLN